MNPTRIDPEDPLRSHPDTRGRFGTGDSRLPEEKKQREKEAMQKFKNAEDAIAHEDLSGASNFCSGA